VHYARNLLSLSLGMVSFGERGELAESLRGVFAAPSRGSWLSGPPRRSWPIGGEGVI
jgi:hypothetical protein